MKRLNRVFIYAVLIVFALYTLVPFLWIILSSFKSDMEIFTGVAWPSKWVWQNYPNAWQKIHMERFFINSVIVTGFSVFLGLVIDILAGYSFAKMAIAKHKWVFYLFLIGIAIPLEANVFSIYLQIKRIGLNNNLWGVILAIVGTGTAFGVFLMRNFFRDMPNVIGESAKIDGASDFQIFHSIYLPLAGPAINALMIFKLLGAWNDFNLSLFILTRQRNWTVPLAVMMIQQNEYTYYGYIFSSAVITFVPILLLTVIFNRSFINGISSGSIKG